VRETLAVSERRACRVLGQVRRTQRYTPRMGDDDAVRQRLEERLHAAVGGQKNTGKIVRFLTFPERSEWEVCSFLSEKRIVEKNLPRTKISFRRDVPPDERGKGQLVCPWTRPEGERSET
jgi:hypothetical protein